MQWELVEWQQGRVSRGRLLLSTQGDNSILNLNALAETDVGVSFAKFGSGGMNQWNEQLNVV